MPHLYQRGSTWWCWFYDSNGNRERRSTRCTDKKAAAAAARRFERAAADPSHDPEAAQATLTKAFELLIRDREEQVLAGRKSQDTVAFYRVKAGHWIRIFERDEDGRPVDFLLAQLQAKHIDAFVSQRRREKASDNTISKELVALRAALKLARRRGLWKGDIGAVMPVAFAPEYRPRDRHLSRPELQALLAKLDQDRAARVAFMVATSANWRESERARREHVSEDLATVFLDGTKRTTRQRSVPMVTVEQRTLLEYALEHAQGDEFLFEPWSNVGRDLKANTDRLVMISTT